MDRINMTQIASFLPQYEIQMQTFTAYEHLYFMSHFKMHRNTTDAEKRQRVTQLLHACGLQEVSHTRIHSLSGGERKRLSLAEELITNPPFIFCDEPTTGLDSYSAYRVIETLRNLCKNPQTLPSSNGNSNSTYQNGIEMDTLHAKNIGSSDALLSRYVNSNVHHKKAIICSVHQPSSELFELFTHIILMDGGRIIFQGSSEHASQFFTYLGYVMPQNCNPADFYLKTISDSHTQRKDGAFIKSKYEDEVCGRYSGSWLSPSYYKGDSLNNIKKFKKISWIHQVYLLLIRLIIEESRNIKQAVVHWVVFMVTALTLAIMYSGLKTLTQTTIQDIDGLLFMLPFEVVFPVAYSVMNVIPAAMPIMRREVGEGTYNLSAHYVAIVLSYIPLAFLKTFFLFALIYSTTYYTRGFMVFWGMYFVLSLSAITATAYGLFVSTLAENTGTAYELASPLDLIFRLLGGAYYNVDSIPFVKYTSMFYYVNEGLFYKFWINVDKIDCPRGLKGFCVKNGLEVLERNSYKTADYTYWLDCLGLVVASVVFNIFAFTIMRKYVKRTGFY
ncbi:protein brown-like isoform X2 [Eurosta solidaginis]